MVYYPCPGEPSGDSYIVERVGSIVWEVCADDLSSYAVLAELGRRAGFRFRYLRVCGFESHGRYENVMKLVDMGPTEVLEVAPPCRFESCRSLDLQK